MCARCRPFAGTHGHSKRAPRTFWKSGRQSKTAVDESAAFREPTVIGQASRWTLASGCPKTPSRKSPRECRTNGRRMVAWRRSRPHGHNPCPWRLCLATSPKHLKTAKPTSTPQGPAASIFCRRDRCFRRGPEGGQDPARGHADLARHGVRRRPPPLAQTSRAMLPRSFSRRPACRFCKSTNV